MLGIAERLPSPTIETGVTERLDSGVIATGVIERLEFDEFVLIDGCLFGVESTGIFCANNYDGSATAS